MTKLSLLILPAILLISFLVRIWNIDTVPPALYWDEMDVGYQAYSIFKTGKDYFGNTPVLVLQSFADFRAPLLIYITIPFVAFLGLNGFSVRLPEVLLGLIGVFLIYVLSKILFKSERIGLVAALAAGFAPWSFQFSRMAFEANLLLVLFLGGIICFLKGLSNSRWWIASGLLFGLSVFAYNTAKLFTPLILLTLILIYIRKQNLNRNFWIGATIALLMIGISFYTTLFQGGGQRFSEIAVWTDPQLESAINLGRQDSAISYTDNREIGMGARFLDRLALNKITYVADKITQNYLKALSPDFLFVLGDPNLRHSPPKIGEFYRVEFITIVFGIFLIFLEILKKDKQKIFLGLWIILAPIPAALTRDGGTHASRLFLLFPALTIASAAGFFYLSDLVAVKAKKRLVWGVILVWIFSVVTFFNYYFGLYKLEAAKHFQYGFSEAVTAAMNRQGIYDYVIIDERDDSLLMSYLFESKYDPADFHTKINSLPVDFGKFKFGEFKGDKLDNFYFMKPGRRDWYSAFENNIFDGNYLLIVSSRQLEEQTVEKVAPKLGKNQMLLKTIYYKTGEPAFYIIETKKLGVKP